MILLYPNKIKTLQHKHYKMASVIEPVSPAYSPFTSIEPISPATSPISSVTSVSTVQQPIEFTSEWFNQSKKEWRSGKIFSRTKQLFYYKTNTDSLFTLEDYKQKHSNSSNTQNSIYSNTTTWSHCGYIDSKGDKCMEQGIFYEDEVKSNKEYDYEKYTDVHFCKKHTKYQKKEERKRYLQMECIMLERQLKNQED